MRSGAPPSSPDITSDEVVRGSAWAVFSAIIPQGYTFAASVVTARMLGTEGVGRIAFIAFAIETLSLALVGGASQAFGRFVGECYGQGRPGAIRSIAPPMALVLLV